MPGYLFLEKKYTQLYLRGVYLLEISTDQHDCVAILAIEHLVHMQYKDLTTNKDVPLFATQTLLLVCPCNCTLCA